MEDIYWVAQITQCIKTSMETHSQEPAKEAIANATLDFILNIVVGSHNLQRISFVVNAQQANIKTGLARQVVSLALQARPTQTHKAKRKQIASPVQVASIQIV